MYAIHTRLMSADWDYIAREAYATYARLTDRAAVSWPMLSAREQQAWLEAVVRAVSVAIGDLPTPVHVTGAPLEMAVK